MQRIHIVGCGPRTGTTLLTELMISSYDIDLYTDHEDRIGKCPPRDGKVFLTKSPKDIIVIEPIMKMMENLHVIYMLRDPRDMIVSKHGSDSGLYYSNLDYWNNFMPFADALKTHPRFLQIRYEDLTSHPDIIQKQISTHLPFLRQKHKFSEYHRVSNPSSDSRLALGELRPIDTKSIGNWRNHKPRLLAQIQQHGSISDDLIKLGYEKDRSWEKELEGIKPDSSATHASDFNKKSFIKKKLRGKNLRALRVWFYHTSFFLGLLEMGYRLTHSKKSASQSS